MTDQPHDDKAGGPPENLPARRVENETSYEVEIDAHPGAEVAARPAQPLYVDVTRPAGERRPIVPLALQGKAAIKSAAVHHGGRLAHSAGYHGLRSPRYLLLGILWAVAGVFRVAGRQLAWYWHTESHALRSQAAAAGDSKEYMHLHNLATEARRVRGAVLAAEVLGLAGAAAALTLLAPWWAWWAAGTVALPVLARAGRPADRRIIGAATVTPRFRKLTGDIVLRAYYSAKLGNPDKPDQKITFGSTMQRDGDGSRVLVDLPYGTGLPDAVKAKDSIASGLDVQVSQVFLHRDPSSIRRHVLWVADRDPLAVPVGRTPLLSGRPTDVWQPAPFGLDERGQLVTVPLMWNSTLISALPRQGKSFAARALGLYCALDPFVQLGTFDFKGSPDWRKFALVADSCAFGLTPSRAGLPIEIFLQTLLAIKDDVQRRYQQLSELPADVCPEGKLTREIARDPRYGMPVRVLILDEFQEVYDLGEVSKEIASLLTFLVKVAPGAGVILIGATQRPSGVGSGQVAQQFTSFRDNFSVRFGLRTSSWQVSELCLGAGAYSEGLDTSQLLPQYKGVGILRGATDASPTVRTYLADGGDAERILVTARAIRERAGTLSGMAVDEAAPAPVMDVLRDVLLVLEDAPGLHWPVLSLRLAARFPDRWAGATGESVSATVRAAGVPSVDVKVSGRTAKGCRRADVQAAVAATG
jgi:S-DNA-T family DNA segregation ATPase FtsK/SpoIIIE